MNQLVSQTAGGGSSDTSAVEPVTLIVEVRAEPGRAPLVAAELSAAARRWMEEPGCLGVTVLSDPADPARYLVVESFASADAVHIHETTPDTRAFLGRIGPQLAAPPSRTSWRPLPAPEPLTDTTPSTDANRTIEGEALMTSMQHPGEINTRWAAALNAGDLRALLDLYEPDAVLVPPGPDAQPISGLDAIESSLRSLVGLGATIIFEPRYWLQNGDLAMGSIAFHLTGGADSADAPVDMRGVTAEVARRQPNGTWKYVVDHPFAGSHD